MNRLAPPPPTVSPRPTALDDVLAWPLQNALNSLNVQLERELARYRQGRRGSSLTERSVFQPRWSKTGPKGPSRPLNLISVGTRPSSPTQESNRPTPPPPPPNPRLQRSPAPIPAAVPPLNLGVGAIIPQPSAAPQDYMASSEALLESLGQGYGGQGYDTPFHPTPEPPASSPFWNRVLGTPLGLGAILLLLVASAGLGYLLVNPAAIGHLTAQMPWANSDALETDTEGDSPVALATPNSPNRSFQPLSPDLSRQEFTRLDLSTLSTLPGATVRPSNTASTPSTGLAPAASTPGTVAVSPVSPIPPVSPERPQAAAPSVASAPRPTQAPAQSAPRPAAPAQQSSSPTPAPAAPTPASSQNYYVVTDYTGDPSLYESRQIVGDAYVRNFPTGARIQLGSFSSEADAAAHAQTLQGQGINAQVYRP